MGQLCCVECSFLFNAIGGPVPYHCLYHGPETRKEGSTPVALFKRSTVCIHYTGTSAHNHAHANVNAVLLACEGAHLQLLLGHDCQFLSSFAVLN